MLKSGNGIKTRRSIPTLEEALMTCKDRILVNIDKGGTYIKEILPIIRKCGMEKQVIIKRKVSCRESSRGIWNQYQYALYAYHSFMERRRYKSDRKFY